MSKTLNQRAGDFMLRELFLEEPREGFMVASLALADLADRYADSHGLHPTPRRVRQAFALGAAKLVVNGDVLAELSRRGVLFVRLSPQGVLSPLAWSSPPSWLSDRPEVLEWARGEV